MESMYSVGTEAFDDAAKIEDARHDPFDTKTTVLLPSGKSF